MRRRASGGARSAAATSTFGAQARIAESFAKEGKMEEARTFLHGVATTNNQQRVQMVLAEAQILREANLNRDAFDLLEKNLDKLPNNPDLLYESAMTAEKLSRMDVQETQLKKLIQIKPDYAQAYNALGYSWADRNERLVEGARPDRKGAENRARTTPPSSIAWAGCCTAWAT